MPTRAVQVRFPQRAEAGSGICLAVGRAARDRSGACRARGSGVDPAADRAAGQKIKTARRLCLERQISAYTGPWHGIAAAVQHAQWNILLPEPLIADPAGRTRKSCAPKTIISVRARKNGRGGGDVRLMTKMNCNRPPATGGRQQKARTRKVRLFALTLLDRGILRGPGAFEGRRRRDDAPARADRLRAGVPPNAAIAELRISPRRSRRAPVRRRQNSAPIHRRQMPNASLSAPCCAFPGTFR